MKHFLQFLFFLTWMTLSSCENIIGGQGIVIDSEERPLQGVKVSFFINRDSMFSVITDSIGFFDANMLVGCNPNCPKSCLKFTKNGYAPLELKVEELKEKSDTILNSDSLVIKMELLPR